MWHPTALSSRFGALHLMSYLWASAPIIPFRLMFSMQRVKVSPSICTSVQHVFCISVLQLCLVVSRVGIWPPILPDQSGACRTRIALNQNAFRLGASTPPRCNRVCCRSFTRCQRTPSRSAEAGGGEAPGERRGRRSRPQWVHAGQRWRPQRLVSFFSPILLLSFSLHPLARKRLVPLTTEADNNMTH